MTERALKDMTRLGSALADMAGQQLDAVLKELQRPADSAARAADVKVDAGAMAASVMQVVSKLGALLVEVSKYDLVRRDEPVFRVGAPNSISTLGFDADSETSYAFWVENDSSFRVQVRAKLGRGNESVVFDALELEPDLGTLQPGERRRARVSIPKNVEDACVLQFEAVTLDGGEHRIVSQRSVALQPVGRRGDPDAAE
jgi:hypothetical protein